MDQLPQHIMSEDLDEYGTTPKEYHQINMTFTTIEGEKFSLKNTFMADGWDVGRDIFSILAQFLVVKPGFDEKPATDVVDEIVDLYSQSSKRNSEGLTDYVTDGEYKGTFHCNFQLLVLDLSKQLPVVSQAQEKLAHLMSSFSKMPNTAKSEGDMK